MTESASNISHYDGMPSPEEAYWHTAMEYGNHHAFIEATMRCLRGVPQEEARIAVVLGHLIESDSLVARGYDLAADITEPAVLINTWSNIYAIAHDDGAAYQTRAALAELSPLESAQTRAEATKIAAERLGDVSLAESIADPKLQTEALVTLATAPGRTRKTYDVARTKALAAQDWKSVARLARSTSDAEAVAALDLEAISDVEVWLDVVIAAHRVGNTRTERRAQAALVHYQKSRVQDGPRIAKGINDRIAEDRLPFLTGLHSSPALQADGLLHLPASVRSATHYRHIRKLLQQPGVPLVRVDVAMRLAEQSNDPKDIANAARFLAELRADEPRQIVQHLHEQLIVLREDIKVISSLVPPAARPRVVAAIAHRKGDDDLMHAAKVVASKLTDPMSRARALHAVAIIAHDHNLAAEALTLAHDHDKTVAYSMAQDGVQSALPQHVHAKKIVELVRQSVIPPRDTTSWRQRMATIGALSAYTQPAAFERHMRAAVSSTMADYMLGAAACARGAVAPLEQERALVAEARQRLRGYLAYDKGSSVGAGQLARALIERRDASSLGMLYESEVANTATQRRVAHLLIRNRAYRSMRQAEEVVFDPGQPWHHRASFAAELAPQHGDTEYTKLTALTGLSNEALLDVTTYTRERYGVTLDSQTLGWILQGVPEASTHPRNQTIADGITAINTFYERARQWCEALDSLNSQEALMAKLKDAPSQTAYFMVHAGSVVYPHSPAFTPRRFRRFVEGTAQYGVDEKQFRYFATMTDISVAAATALWEGSSPVSQSTWDIYPRQTPPDLEAPLRRLFSQHKAVLDSIDVADRSSSRALIASVFGETVATLCTEADGPIDAAHVLTGLNQAGPHLAHRVIQYRNALRAQGIDRAKVQKWTAYAQRIKTLPVEQLPGALLGFLHRDPQYPIESHVTRTQADILLQHLEKHTRTERTALRARILDKRRDLMQYSRFADATSNCYQSISIDRPYGSRAEYFDRIWKDPCMFAVQLESSDRAHRPIGFVFGTIGFLGDRSALLLNGVYLQKRDDTVARAVIASMRSQIAEPLGLKAIAFAARHGGTFRPGFDYDQAEGQGIIRYSALRTGSGLVKHTFDDLSLSVNDGPVAAHRSMWSQIW